MSREPKPLLRGRGDLRAARFGPDDLQMRRVLFGDSPMHRYAAGTVRQRAVLGRVRRKFMHRHGYGKRRLGKEPDVGTIDVEVPAWAP